MQLDCITLYFLPAAEVKSAPGTGLTFRLSFSFKFVPGKLQKAASPCDLHIQVVNETAENAFV